MVGTGLENLSVLTELSFIALGILGVYLYKKYYTYEEPVIRCPKCGQYNKRTEIYCRDCGYKFSKKK
jgi:DNA-directed RNA polymerase subunit RPC12/RpoP